MHNRTKTEQFRATLSPELDAELIALANRPGITVLEIFRWLLEQGYTGSYRGVCTWHTHQKNIGESARRFNDLLKAYEGVSAEKALSKLLVVFHEQLDVALANIATTEQPIDGSDYLKTLPQLGREIRACVEAMNSLKFVRDRKELEVAGAYRMGQSLKELFKDAPFLDALEEGVDCVLIEIEGEE